MYAYVFLELTKMGIDVAGESQLVGYPTQFPDVSMVNWENGNPNARYWVLKLIKDNFGPGDQLVSSAAEGSLFSQAFITKSGKKILLINRQNTDLKVALPVEAKGKTIRSVDVSTGENPPSQVVITDNTIALKPFAVAVVQMN
jgi:hypothetical protein